MSDVETEWARAQAAGRRQRRPLVLGVVAGVVATALSISGLMLVLEADLEAKTARVERGEIVYERSGGRTILGLLLLPVLVGFGAGFGVFKAAGGKVAPEYRRGGF
jgi:hypothetical protein